MTRDDQRTAARSDLDEAQRAIGYAFRHVRLLNEALTHKSYVNEARDKSQRHNERLEFLGDAVLALVVSEHLAASFPNSTEGELSTLKARLVSEASLARAAGGLGLGTLLRLGRGEERTKGREKHSLLADALEAIIAAIYLDGGLEPVRAFVLRVLGGVGESQPAWHEAAIGQDYKTRFQEWCQKRYEVLPKYVTIRESGPDHQKTFEVQVRVGEEVLGTGIGRTKKEAEQMAAKQALKEAAER